MTDKERGFSPLPIPLEHFVDMAKEESYTSLPALTLGSTEYPVELNNSLPVGTWYLRKGKPMPVNLNEDELKKAAAQISSSLERIKEQMVEDAMFGEWRPSAPTVSTARMASSIARSPHIFKPSPLPLSVITSPYVFKSAKRSREKKRGFWRRLWGLLTDINQWPLSHIEFYEEQIPALMIDKRRHLIICHPAIEQEIKQAVRKGDIRSDERR